MESAAPAEQALQLLFKKLHPHLEDAAHALAEGARSVELELLYRKLVKACDQSAEILDDLAEASEGALSEILGTLSANLTPVGASYRQLLTLVQLCLEEAPADLLPFVAEGAVAESSWGKRMVGFLARLEDPRYQAHIRWKQVDPELGDEGMDEDED